MIQWCQNLLLRTLVPRVELVCTDTHVLPAHRLFLAVKKVSIAIELKKALKIEEKLRFDTAVAVDAG